MEILLRSYLGKNGDLNIWKKEGILSISLFIMHIRLLTNKYGK